ncbi:hypothetical protein, partial [Microcoleus sp. D3_18a_C4]|uniref:hypothetical protein n=1 Tax=unclassified Microcoleus TaxID=2642155 RepID=UPI002FD468CE
YFKVPKAFRPQLFTRYPLTDQDSIYSGLTEGAKCSIAHHRPSTFIYTKKFKIFDRTYCPKPDFRIELLSSVSFH